MAEAEKEDAAKKQKVNDEARRIELVEELAQRDQSIFALRRLLAEKKAKLTGDEAVPLTPQKGLEYGTMALDVLKRLDKARDATIAAILKQMDKIDEDLKLLEGLDDDALDELEETDPSKPDQSDGSKQVAAKTMEGTRFETGDGKSEPEQPREQEDKVSAAADGTGVPGKS